MKTKVTKKNARRILDSMASMLKISSIGAHSYDGNELFFYGSNYVELLQTDRTNVGGIHSKTWYEIPFPSNFTKRILSSSIVFRQCQFISLDEVAYYLKIDLAIVEYFAAKVLMKHILNGGISTSIISTSIIDDEISDFKANSIEEIMIKADLG